MRQAQADEDQCDENKLESDGVISNLYLKDSAGGKNSLVTGFFGMTCNHEVKEFVLRLFLYLDQQYDNKK